MRGTKKRSFTGKFTGGGAGKTEPASREWRREAAASRINQKRATRVKPSRPYFFVEEEGFTTEHTESTEKNVRVQVKTTAGRQEVDQKCPPRTAVATKAWGVCECKGKKAAKSRPYGSAERGLTG